MLKIRREQMETFHMQRQALFEQRMMDYLRVTFPTQTKSLTDNHLRETVQQGERKAQDYDIVYEDDIRRFLGYVVVYGLTLDLQATSGGKSTRVTWSSDAETEELRQLRQSLEDVGHLAFVEAKAYAARGHALVHAGAVAAGIEAFRTGLNSLADRYSDPQRVDDTGLKLVLAEQNRKGGKLEVAATLYERVLNNRLNIYAAHKLSTGKSGTPRP